MTALHLVTTERDHLVEIAGLLVKGLSDEFLQNAAKPVVISVQGSIWSGKKIFPDAAVQTMFGIPDARRSGEYEKLPPEDPRPHFSGRQGYDEYWRGVYRGRPVEITFIDAAYGAGYERIRGGLADPRETLEKFLSLRVCGGVTFLQNAWHWARANSPDIDIWLENKHAPPVEHAAIYRSEKAPFRLRTLFSSEANPYRQPWTRYIAIDVPKQALRQSPQFAAALEFISSRGPLFT